MGSFVEKGCRGGDSLLLWFHSQILRYDPSRKSKKAKTSGAVCAETALLFAVLSIPPVPPTVSQPFLRFNHNFGNPGCRADISSVLNKFFLFRADILNDFCFFCSLPVDSAALWGSVGADILQYHIHYHISSELA